jgi:hypothetical protein
MSEFAGGDVVYPAEAAPGNTADLIQLQIGLEDGALRVRAIVETLVDPALPVTLTIDGLVPHQRLSGDTVLDVEADERGTVTVNLEAGTAEIGF